MPCACCCCWVCRGSVQPAQWEPHGTGTCGMSGRKGLKIPEFRVSLCSKFALRELLCLPVRGLACILALRPALTRGYLWLMGSTAFLCFLIQTFQSPTGDKVMSSCLHFGNAYFMNVKKIGCTCMLHPWSCQLHVSIYICISSYCEFCHGMIKHIEPNTLDQQTFGRQTVFAVTEPCLSRNIGKRGCQGKGTECCL